MRRNHQKPTPEAIPSASVAGLEIVASPLMASYRLADRRNVVTHVLGNQRVVCTDEQMEILRWLATPRAFELAREKFRHVPDAEASLSAFHAASLIQSTAADERRRIRRIFSSRFAPPDLSEILSPAELPDPSPAYRVKPASHPAHSLYLATDPLGLSVERRLSPKTVLRLSSSLAVLRLSLNDLLVTHPAERRLHLSASLWHIARAFRHPASLAQATAKLKRVGLSTEEIKRSCLFLYREHLLWLSEEEEERFVAMRFAGVDPRAGARALELNCEQWEQKFLPYDPKFLRSPSRFGLVACLGGCQVHAYIPALKYLGQLRGWQLEIEGMMNPGPALAKKPWSLVILSLANYCADLYEALALGDFERGARLLPSLSAQADFLLAKLRQHTEAPILVQGVGKPGLSSGSDPVRTAALLAELNGRIQRSARSHSHVFYLDEDSVVAEHGGKVQWDDEFNAVPHHSCVSLWGRPPRDLSVDPRGFENPREDSRPPIAPGQRDPTYAFARAYLDRLDRLYEDRPVKLIVFEPNELLWNGRLEDKASAYPEGFNFYTGDYYSFFLGASEALRALKDRGIKLACLSSCPAPLLAERWQLRSRFQNLLRREDVDLLVGGNPRDRLLRELVAKSGVAEQNALYLDLTREAPENFQGRVYRGGKWGLRRFLLTAPEVNPVSSSLSRRKTEPRIETRPVPAADLRTLESRFAEILRRRLKCPPAEADRLEDLRLGGLDSLGAAELARELEETLGLVLADANYQPAILFFRSRLLDALRRAATADPIARSSAPSVLSADYPTWCKLDLASILRAHAMHPPRPWILKFLRSSRAGDYEYVSWPQLYEQALGFTRLYQERGLEKGDVVLLLLPQGSPLIAALVGAVLGGFLPSVSAFPNEKLPEEIFAGWFAKVIRASGSRLLITSPELRASLQRALGREGLELPILAEAPSPRREDEVELPRLGADDPLLVQHSSGTTGLKKAVLLRHRAVLAQVWRLSEALHCGADDVIVSWLPLYHDMGLVACLLLPLLRSIPTVLISPFDWVKSPELLFEQISDEKGTLCWLPNFAYLHSARRIPPHRLAPLDLSSLRAIISCSEPVTAGAVSELYSKLAASGLSYSALSSSYAMAETVFAVTQSPLTRTCRLFAADRHELEKGSRLVPWSGRAEEEKKIDLVSSGRPLPEVELQIVGEDGKELEPGRIGEIRIRAPWQMDGYFGDPAATREALRDGWYHSGDLGAFLDGELYVTGRKKDLIIVAGTNIYPHFVEEVVSAIPGIHAGRVAAFGVFEPDLGSERLVVLAEAERADPKLRAQVSESILGNFSMSAEVHLVEPRTLRKSSSGKISRAMNRELYLQSPRFRNEPDLNERCKA